ncbi:hypothetical protein F4859DRAFT_515579 [Xylaria cf. heliscus]|nr:hypothetical protein F4859DRAFT_515579 [Xylaria cf. heliscus]
MSTSGSALAQLKQFALGPRSLFVKCAPAPTSFHERRAVLAVLQTSSEQSIETFKKLQDSSSFIAVTTSPDAATTLLDNSPLKRTIVCHDASNDVILTSSAWSTKYEDVCGPIAARINPLPAAEAVEPAKSTPASADLGLSYKQLTLHIFPANAGYDHRGEVRKSPLHGPWPGNGKTETFMSAALKRVIPSGSMAPALRDWETGNQLGCDSDSFADDGPEGAASTLLGKKRLSAREVFLMERLRGRRVEETPKVMNSLYQFAEECRAQTAKAQPEPPIQTTNEPSPGPDTPEDSPFKWLLGKWRR